MGFNAEIKPDWFGHLYLCFNTVKYLISQVGFYLYLFYSVNELTTTVSSKKEIKSPI